MSTKQKQDLINTVTEMRKDGATWAFVAHYLNTKKLRTLSGKNWSGAYLARWFTNTGNAGTSTVQSAPQEEITMTWVDGDALTQNVLTRALLTATGLSDSERVQALRSIYKAA